MKGKGGEQTEKTLGIPITVVGEHHGGRNNIGAVEKTCPRDPSLGCNQEYVNSEICEKRSETRRKERRK